MQAEPTFTMPTCGRHFFKGHKWWCHACDRETASQFREVCESWWRVPQPEQDFARASAKLAGRVSVPPTEG